MRFIAIVPILLAFAGCAEQDVLQYQGRPATTALECQAAYEAAKDRVRSSPGDYSSGGAALGTAIGRSLVKGMTESHYQTCLSRVAGLAPGTGALAAPANPPPPATAYSTRVTTPYRHCNLQMVGGSGYACVPN